MPAILENERETLTRRLAECVVKDPERLGGVPIFRGTRVPVKSLFDYLGADDSVETFLVDFPGVSQEQIRTVIAAAGLHLLEEFR